MELPGWVVDVFYFVGLPWPAIDEDELRGWANDLREFATEITELSRLSHDAVQGLKDSNEAGVVKTMAEHWDHHHAQMMAMREPMHAFASALDVVAEAVFVQKGVVIGEAIALAGEIAATQGEALFTLGIAEAEVPAEVALTKMAVKFALQELELKIIGYLINKAAKEISDHVSQTVSKMLMGGGQVVFEAISLKLDYDALQRVADTARKHKNRAETDSIRAHRRATARKIETSERGGKWPVVQVLVAALISIAEDIFKRLPGALHTVLEDTEKDLKKAIAKSRETDKALADGHPKPDGPLKPDDVIAPGAALGLGGRDRGPEGIGESGGGGDGGSGGDSASQPPDDGMPAPGPGEKLLQHPDESRLTRGDAGLITHVDGRPVNDHLDDIARQRGADYRDAKDAGTFSRKQTGACVGAAADLRTGRIMEGINGRPTDTISPDDLHPTLADRYKAIENNPPHPDQPLGHAEVKAVNQLLWERKKLGLPDDESALAEMRVSVQFPFLKDPETGIPGRPAPFCANCNHMLQDVPSSAGRFTAYPPSDDNFLPR